MHPGSVLRPLHPLKPTIYPHLRASIPKLGWRRQRSSWATSKCSRLQPLATSSCQGRHGGHRDWSRSNAGRCCSAAIPARLCGLAPTSQLGIVLPCTAARCKTAAGIGAIVLNGVTVGEDPQAAGAVVTRDVPARFVAGVPATVKRVLTEEK